MVKVHLHANNRLHHAASADLEPFIDQFSEI